MYYDAHCHYISLRGKKYDEFIIAAVSMDYDSSLSTVSLKNEKILVGVGIHPWNVHNENLDRVLELTEKADFIGEVGLDYRYAKADKESQIKYFQAFVDRAIEEDKLVNVHALDAWRDSFNILTRSGVKRAIFHWYTGPEDLLKDIEGAGYYITINPSVSFQQKHLRVLEKAPLEIILTESDGGYEYRGKMLEPTDIPIALKIISKVKAVEEEELKRIIERNFKNAFGGD
ncbi:TatD family hydrolase [Sulfolobus acidocaldarius]|uniref:Deoxyribonuclease n=4 Tax=Sulfolobus acidocaldarius TaxID=2285 RepID=Q4J996_SULAC|nr:TatD family hydrolase [Sulfolobus acidocaldarius]AAY80635.1 deoxyribonuclease [Sulfolobus acidocaldarius DSM 639]AGE71227.1 deoxyribonuclease [Sulfolobus acidocaldarius N8]AGE73497.1 deoxyribonuclease [Sulfolobus acidocaldarius Ron12/I]ALU28516.1 hydrolase TatD [Sulfolobus acidocaldarius]ALU31224.1 hydrolase TatD [Sulfolobus acidocaldarius]